MKNPVKAISKIAGVIALAIFLTACNKSYKAILADNEGTPTAVAVDGRPDGGKVKRVYVDASGRRVAEFTVSRDAENLIRDGVVRVPGGEAIQLRTDLATGQPLPSGSYIRAESSLGIAAKTWGTKALAIVAVAAIAAVICLRRFLAFRAAAPFIPLLLATGLALLTAYSAHGLMVPIARDVVQKIQAKAESPNGRTEHDERNVPDTDQGWANKARAIERDAMGFLRTPVDAPRLLAFLATFAIALPLFACLIAWLFHKLTCQPIVCGLVLLVAVPSALNAAPARDGVFRTLASLKEEQRFSQQLLSEIERDVATANRLLDATVTGASELAVRALFLSDLVGIRLEGHTERIGQLKSAFGYVRADEQRKLTTAYTGLRQQLQTLQLDASKLAERCSTATNATTVVSVFRAKQPDYRNLIRAGLSDVKIVLDECNRQVAKVSEEARKEPKSTETGKTAAEFAQVKREQAQLQEQLATLRRAQEEAASRPPVAARIIVVTNQVEKLVPVPAPAPPPEVRYVTNTVVREQPERILMMPERGDVEQVQAVAGFGPPEPSEPSRSTASGLAQALPAINTQQEHATLDPKPPKSKTIAALERQKPEGNPPLADGELAARSTVGASSALKPRKASTAPSAFSSSPTSFPKSGLLGLGIAGVLALGALSVIGLARIIHRRFDVIVAMVHSDGRTTQTTLTLQPKAERIILGPGDPKVEPSDLQHAIPPSISVDWFGRATIRAGTASVSIANTPIDSGAGRARIGDEIRITFSDSETEAIYVIREITAAAGDVVELEEAAQTIN